MDPKIDDLVTRAIQRASYGLDFRASSLRERYGVALTRYAEACGEGVSLEELVNAITVLERTRETAGASR